MQDAAPTPNRFVARAPGLSASALASRLRGVGPVETFEEGDAVIVDLPDAPGGARAGWERLRATFGDAVEFLPVLRGASDGESTVPTGQVTVRFRSVPTAEAVRAFAADHALTPASAREPASRQVRFVPGGAGRFLPDVIEALRADARAVDAWPEVWLRVAFERARTA